MMIKKFFKFKNAVRFYTNLNYINGGNVLELNFPCSTITFIVIVFYFQNNFYFKKGKFFHLASPFRSFKMFTICMSYILTIITKKKMVLSNSKYNPIF